MFGLPGGSIVRGCWCMYYRTTGKDTGLAAGRNKGALRGLLYGLRSNLVHGASIKGKDLRKVIESVPTVPGTAPFGVALAFTVDRLRDLV